MIQNNAIKYTNYIANGTLYSYHWLTEDTDGNEVEIAYNELPVASADLGTVWYEFTADETKFDGGLTVKKVNASLYENFGLNLYVLASETTIPVDGKVTIDGVEYVVFTTQLNANAIAKDVDYVVSFEKDGTAYTELVTVNLILNTRPRLSTHT